MNGKHQISAWEYQQIGIDPDVTGDQEAHYVMRVYGWLCASHATWGAEESPRARTHAIERHVGGLPDPFSPDNMVRLIERWWEEEASYTADCAAPDPSLCSNHVFEEAVRVGDEIVACTVHGGRLARSLAAFLVQRQRELEQQIWEAFKRDHARNAERWKSLTHGTWAEDTHAPGCGAGRHPEKRCI